MKIQYTNVQTNQTYILNNVSDFSVAWSMNTVNFVCERMGWNLEMFADDVRVRSI